MHKDTILDSIPAVCYTYQIKHWWLSAFTSTGVFFNGALRKLRMAKRLKKRKGPVSCPCQNGYSYWSLLGSSKNQIIWRVIHELENPSWRLLHFMNAIWMPAPLSLFLFTHKSFFVIKKILSRCNRICANHNCAASCL